MSRTRLAISIALTLGVAGALGWLYFHGTSTTASTGSFELRVVGPEGKVLFNGTLQARNATALSLLQLAGNLSDFPVQVSWFQGYGRDPCNGFYVVSVAGQEATASGGWVYRVRANQGSTWTYPAHSGACEGLTPGDQVEWHWGNEGDGSPPSASS